MSEPSSHQKHVTDTIPHQKATGVLPVMPEIKFTFYRCKPGVLSSHLRLYIVDAVFELYVSPVFDPLRHTSCFFFNKD